MAVSFDNVSLTTATSGTSISWTHVGAASPSNYLAVVGVSHLPATVSSVTFGGSTMTLIKSIASGSEVVDMYGIISPLAGSQTVVVNFSVAITNAIGGAITFTGADQTTGWHNSQSVIVGSAASVSLTITSAIGEMTTTAITRDSSILASTNQTQRWNAAAGGLSGAGDTALGAASVTHTWSQGTVANYMMVGTSILAAAAAAVSFVGIDAMSPQALFRRTLRVL